MAIKKLILGRTNDKTNIVFDKQINVVEDLVLSKELGTENIKNEDSTLIIKSMSDTQIADVIQIKINLTAVGTLLVNFEKNSLKEENRKAMFEALSALKNKEESTEKTQTEKFSKILSIIEKFKPEYVAFSNNKNIKINVQEVSKKTKWNFPLLVLALPPEKTFVSKLKWKYFHTDFLFCTIFALLGSFALTVGVNEITKNIGLSIFLLVMTAVFAGLLCYASYESLTTSKDKKLKFVIIIYAAIGVVLGFILGVIIAKFIFNKETPTDIVKLSLFGGAGSLVISVCAILVVSPIKKLFSKIKK